jgi:hypothetical protein
MLAHTVLLLRGLIGDDVSLFRVFGMVQGMAHMPRERMDEGIDGTFYAL